MPFNIGPMELIIVLAIALIVLGPKKLPEVGRSIGRGHARVQGLRQRRRPPRRATSSPRPAPRARATGADG